MNLDKASKPGAPLFSSTPMTREECYKAKFDSIPRCKKAFEEHPEFLHIIQNFKRDFETEDLLSIPEHAISGPITLGLILTLILKARL